MLVGITQKPNNGVLRTRDKYLKVILINEKVRSNK